MNTRPALCLLCSLGGIASPLLAAPDPLAHLSDHFAPELADGELAHLRGRYVSSHGISYFGIEFMKVQKRVSLHDDYLSLHFRQPPHPYGKQHVPTS